MEGRFRTLLGLALGLVTPLAIACSAANGDPGNGPAFQQGTGGANVGGSPATGGNPNSGGASAGGAESGGTPGNGGGSAGAVPTACGDGYCDVTEDCWKCPSDCVCGAGGATGTGGAGTGGAGTGGAATGGSGGTVGDPTRQAAMDRAKVGVGFSYWWGHGAYLPPGPTPATAGTCSGSGCPSCTHSGSYGGDCSGYVAKVWQIPSSNTDMSVDSHPYSTGDFVVDSSQWTTIDQGTMLMADAMVYHSGGAGHIFLYDHGDPWGSMYAYECKGCSYGCTAGMRTATTAYHAIRRTGY